MQHQLNGKIKNKIKHGKIKQMEKGVVVTNYIFFHFILPICRISLTNNSNFNIIYFFQQSPFAF